MSMTSIFWALTFCLICGAGVYSGIKVKTQAGWQTGGGTDVLAERGRDHGRVPDWRRFHHRMCARWLQHGSFPVRGTP